MTSSFGAGTDICICSISRASSTLDKAIVSRTAATVPSGRWRVGRSATRMKESWSAITGSPGVTRIPASLISASCARATEKILATVNPSAREKVYQSLGLRLEYDHEARRVTAIAAEACVFNRVRRGT